MDSSTITFPILGEWATFNFSRFFTIFGFKIYWYGVIIAIGVLLGILYVVKRCGQFGLKEDNVVDALIFGLPSGIICARLFFVIFSTDSSGANEYFENPIKIFAIRDGGLAIYGGVIGAVLAIFIYSRVKRVSFASLADLTGLGLLIGQTVGRWANFVNRECYGFETSVPWKMGLTLGDVTTYVHPTFLYESLWNLIGFVLLHFYSKRGGRRFKGQIFLMYLGWYGIGRFYIEGMRTDSLYFFTTGIRTSQLIALLCVAVSITAQVVIIIRRRSGTYIPEELSQHNPQKQKNSAHSPEDGQGETDT